MDQPDRDHGLVELALAGDQEAFGQLVERHQTLVATVAWRYGIPRDDIEDMVSEVFLKVYQKLPGYRPDFAFSTWLYRVAANHVMDRGRKTKREGLRVEMPSEIADSKCHSPRAHLEQRERVQLLREAIRELKPAFREILFLVHVEGHRLTEACRILGIPSGTAKVRMMRGRRALKQLLLAQHPGYFGE